ncbi:D-alanyl-D-alanine carboxypeptidase family protein [Rhizobium grahamii]|uniref:D-alanyl-D-alanine carboxypeptidase n=1 Tax=Rhizobium grahamii CCGE 502 TaxID=990285 RepID=S3H7H7_9HYPH|nr:serine hydrolase [Rhizobium grahamii]EPE94862.1 D-alanyl-D-alanine carboxypeptidase [Rhizobium grahamii CCGE 502]
MTMTSTGKGSARTSLLLAALLLATPVRTTPVLVVDGNNREVLYQEDAGLPWFPASTTKLMTALVVFEALRAGEVTLTTPVTMTRNSVKQAFLDSGLSLGRTMTLEDALFATITASANDVAVALAEAVAFDELSFVKRMNDEARRLGMSGTHFASPNGLFDRSNYTTARDGTTLISARAGTSSAAYRATDVHR